MSKDYDNFQKILGYQFKDINLLITALTHSSASSNNYERLEYLGDSLLSIIVAEYLYTKTNLNVGEMSVKRSSLVSTDALSKIVCDNGFKDYIILGQSVLGTHNIAKNILADVFESITGAIYLDSNFDKAKEFVYRFILKDVDNLTYIDSKTKLQEKLASIDSKLLITYKIIKSEGPSHDMRFAMGLYINDMLIDSATGKSKKEAEQICAKAVYEKLCKNGIGSILK